MSIKVLYKLNKIRRRLAYFLSSLNTLPCSFFVNLLKYYPKKCFFSDPEPKFNIIKFGL